MDVFLLADLKGNEFGDSRHPSTQSRTLAPAATTRRSRRARREARKRSAEHVGVTVLGEAGSEALPGSPVPQPRPRKASCSSPAYQLTRGAILLTA